MLTCAMLAAGCTSTTVVSTPTPTATPQTSPSAAGVSKYPGAVTIKDTADLVELTSSDDPAKVAEFYAKELGVKPRTVGGLTSLDGKASGKKVVVAIAQEAGKTSISIMTEK
jgi:hypothetical protein